MKHPSYMHWLVDYDKYRLTMEGGSNFVSRYVVKFSDRESDTDFATRKSITPCAAYAKSGIQEIANSIFQRITEVTRIGGSEKYSKAISGLDPRGVDLRGNNMESFIATNVLLELLAMGKVGIFVDMPAGVSYSSLAEAKDLRPYIYTYSVEQILNYAYDETGNLKALELEQCTYTFDEIGLPTAKTSKNKKIFKENGQVVVLTEGEPARVLDIEQIPFIILELPCSLLEDVADYQIALTNFLSSDIYYGIKANFPFYVEEADNRSIARYVKEDDNEAFEDTDKDTEASVGPLKGRQYAQGTQKPDFIHPSSEPLKANMEKEEQMKREIRNLLHLAVQSLQPVRASSDSKEKDFTGLEAGLSRIGLELERFENKVADIWAHYMGDKVPAEIRYPKKYQLKSDEDKIEQAKKLADLKTAVPSIKYQKEISKTIAVTLLAHRIGETEMDTIKREIDAAEVANVDPKILHQDIEDGIISHEAAAKAKGYPEGDLEIATKEHADRLKLIQESQTPVDAGARGLPDSSVDPDASSKEKEGKEKRGEGKNAN